MATNMKRILMPMGMHPAGMALVDARDDVEAVVLNNFTTAQFRHLQLQFHHLQLPFPNPQVPFPQFATAPTGTHRSS